MRFLLGLIGIMLMTFALTGCDKETQAAETTPGNSGQVAAQQEEQTAEGVAVAKPVEQDNYPAGLEPDAVVVTVNGEPIKNVEIIEEVDKRVETLKKRMPEGQEVTQAQRQQLRVGVEDALVQQEVLDQQLAKKDISITDEDVLNEIEKAARANGQTLDEVKAEITQYGMTIEDLKSQVRPQVEMKQLAEAYMDDPDMQEKAKEFYKENPSYFEVPEQVRASHVLIKVEPDATEAERAAAKKKAEEVLDKAKAGEDFAALAKAYSDDPGSKDTGGEYTFGRGKMVKPFEEAAFALDPNEVSDLVETQFGYHIIKLSEKTEAETIPFEDAQQRIVSFLLQKQMQEDVNIEYSEAEQALRQKVQQQQMMQQQMMQQLQRQMAEQQAQQAAQQQEQPTQTPESAKEEPAAEE